MAREGHEPEERRAVAVIPARYASTRFPGKPLARETGKTLLEHVWRRVKLAESLERVVVAADDERIVAACAEFGAECVMTPSECASGAERCAEAARGLDGDVVVCVPCDMPEVDPEHVNEVAWAMTLREEDEKAKIATLVHADETASEAGRARFLSPDVVKVLQDQSFHAITFTRAPVPYDGERGGVPPRFLRHVDLFAFDRKFLAKMLRSRSNPMESAFPRGSFVAAAQEAQAASRKMLDPTTGQWGPVPAGHPAAKPYEQRGIGDYYHLESLEPLRWIELGYRISLASVIARDEIRAGIDTPEEYAAFVRRWRAEGS